jgi:hypothetical protein
MIVTLFTIFKTTTVIAVTCAFLKRTNPQKYENLVVGVSFNMIYLFSKCQILFGKLSARVTEFIKSYPQLKAFFTNVPIQNQICQIRAGNICVKNHTTDVANYFADEDGSFYLFVDNAHVSESGCVNRVVLRLHPFTSNYEPSDTRFLLFEVKIHDTFYKINLSGETYNYYIVNNIVDKRFLVYFLKQYRVYNLTDHDIRNIKSFTVKIIDQNVNVKTMEITDEHFITIKKIDYIYSQ